MKKILTFACLLVSSSLLINPVQATTRSNSEKLQNKIDNFETNLVSLVDDLDAAQDLELDDDSIEDDGLAEVEASITRCSKLYFFQKEDSSRHY